jgi:deazaflavin-dependent oxidoreductase (nitroreductase family)
MFRHGLGWLFGSRLVVLEHRGRTTGLPRHVVLEVIASEPGRLTVVSGYGSRSQWYRNILADPHVRVWTGRTLAAQALASAMPAAEAVAMLEDYRDRHRRAARALGKVLSIPDLVDARPFSPDIVDRLPLVCVALEPASSGS